MTRLTVLLLTTLTLAAGCGAPPAGPAAATPEVSAAAGTAGATAEPIAIAEGDWPMWRGSNADGVGAGPAVPVTWNETQNVVWKTKIPGRGHSSPIVVADRIFLETADETAQSQSVVAIDRKTGESLWETKLFAKGFETAMHPENTQATSTIACDGKRLFCLFLNDRKIWAVALDLDGKELWRTDAGNFSAKFGFSASPTVHQSHVLIAADHQGGGFLAALDRISGKIIWRKSRPAKSSYASPRVVSLGGREQLVICGCNIVASYDPQTGEKLWETPGSAEAGVGTLVTAGDLVFASAGYPESQTLGLKADGTVAWKNANKSYCPSLLAYEGHVYQIADDGILRCYAAETGKETWKQRVGGRYRVSPVVSGGNIFITDMEGKTTVFRANPEKYEQVAENRLGNEGFASPAISHGQLFLRVADSSGNNRQEWLYCIGTE